MTPATLKRYLTDRFAPNLFCRRRAYIFALSPSSDTGTPSHSPSLPPGHFFRVAHPAELNDLCTIAGVSRQASKARWEAKDSCYAVFEGEQAVNMNWVHRGACFVRGLGYVHEAGESQAYIYSVFTHPKARGLGIYTNALRLLADELFQSGVSQLSQLVEAQNAIVLGTLPRLGYTKIKTIVHTRLLGTRCTTVTEPAHGFFRRYFFILQPRNLYVI